MKSKSELKSHTKWWDFKTPKWVSISFISFCIAMATVATITVDDNPHSIIEYRTSVRTYDDNIESPGTKCISWRVRQSDVPRWKRLTNRWHKLHWTEVYWTEVWGYYFTRAEMHDTFTIEQFTEIRDKYKTVEQIRKYEEEQDELFRQNDWKAQKEEKMKEAKRMWKEVK